MWENKGNVIQATCDILLPTEAATITKHFFAASVALNYRPSCVLPNCWYGLSVSPRFFAGGVPSLTLAVCGGSVTRANVLPSFGLGAVGVFCGWLGCVGVAVGASSFLPIVNISGWMVRATSIIFANWLSVVIPFSLSTRISAACFSSRRLFLSALILARRFSVEAVDFSSKCI